MTMTLDTIVQDHLAGRCERTPAGHCTCSSRYAEVLDAPAKVTRPVREQYTVDADDLLAFRAEVRHAGMSIVCSSPIGNDRYAVTVQH